MSNSSGTSSQITSLPKGGGALRGVGEKFSPDLFTGTGNFTIPIALPPGRNGFQPELNLVYSTGNGNGPFGLGWALSIPGVSRKTSKGVPRYDDENDVFVLSGAEDLVPVKKNGRITRYCPRTEGLFARIEHHHNATDDYWKVWSKDGLRSRYGTKRPDDADPEWQDPAVVADPTDKTKVFSWKLTKTEDPFGNRIEYEYDRDIGTEGPPGWDQLYLKRIRYVDYTQGDETKFLVSVTFHYEDRPDPFSEYRAGFEIRTRRRCNLIEIRTHPDQHCEDAEKGLLVRTYHLIYIDQREDLKDRWPLNGVSLLSQIKVVGHDEQQEDEEDRTEELPPLEFNYTHFEPERRDFFPLTGSLPARSLADPNLELVDLFGNGLPDILEMNGTVRYWRNLGNGRFDLPRAMKDAPAGLSLADKGVQLLDATGDGRADLMVTTESISGYYPTRFGGHWDRRSFQRYATAPSFDLEDPEVRLLDLDGDGVTDAVRSGSRLECYFNDPEDGWGETRWVERRAIEEFPNVSFSDPRVRFADMSGDGLQDAVIVHDGNVEYWPNFGYGDWGPRRSMHKAPRFPYGYDPRRILVGDVDGDGLTDIVYVDDTKVTLWINQSGNAWSAPIVIRGTPPVSDLDAVRLADVLGTGISGVLWSRDAGLESSEHYYFLDFTGGLKPYLLNEMDNHMGAVTRVQYTPSTQFYLEDEKRPQTGWLTPLPFPVQTVSQVEVIDAISGGKLTTEYTYHHGYWDGAEREFRGFGRVDQRDTETFERYNSPGLHTEWTFQAVESKTFSPPLETRTWFHQGPIGDEFGSWEESDFTREFWADDPNVLTRPSEMDKFLKALARRVRRDALRTLRGRILRTELYALDGTERQNRPYTVTEYLHGVAPVPVGQSWPEEREQWQQKVFFPHALAQRVTQWERGDDPMTRFSFTGDYDKYGQPCSQIAVAVPCGRDFLVEATADEAYLITQTETDYAQRDDDQRYIVDRVCRTTTYEIPNDGGPALFDLVKDIKGGEVSGPVIGQTLNFYDGPEFEGLPFGQLDEYGALVRTENLVLTEDILREAYGSGDNHASAAIPPYLSTEGQLNWTGEYPEEFRGLPDLAGYTYHPDEPGSEYAVGYFAATERRQYDFHDGGARVLGLLTATQDPFEHRTSISYDACDLLPVEVTDPANLTTEAEYDYRVLQPKQITDPNGNVTTYAFTPLGLLKSIAVMGKDGEEQGDTPQQPGTLLEYDFTAFDNSPPDQCRPIFVHTIRREEHRWDLVHDENTKRLADGLPPLCDEEIAAMFPHDELETFPERFIQSREYSDGFGRLLQTRTQAEDVVFGDPVFGGNVLPGNRQDQAGTLADVVGQQRAESDPPNVVVSGWQIYDNKGRVVEKYEPFFSKDWTYLSPEHESEMLGVDVRREKITMYYDPRGQVIRTVNPDGSQQRVVYGVPGTIAAPDLTDPDAFEPTPWESYTYDENDNGGRTHGDDLPACEHHYNTPSNALLDALGRTVLAVQRNKTRQPDNSWSGVQEYETQSTYDIRGNLLTVKDPLQRLAFQYVYDLANNPLRIQSIDAGVRRTVLDAAGNEIERRDSKGAVALQAYDVLNRPVRMWARNTTGQTVTLRERVVYGDGADAGLAWEDARAENLLGKPYKHHDEAGRLIFDRYDFKGNLQEKIRRVISDAAVENGWTADWDAPAAENDLDNTEYRTTTQYDAINRAKKIQYPADVGGNRAVLTPHYNRAGALERVELDEAPYVTRIAYNAKGQRTLIAYGNGVMTRHAYDPSTFRLTRLCSERHVAPLPAPFTYRPTGQALQDFAYSYDLAGNILQITDRTPGGGLPAQPDELKREFVYDPLYQLVSATGREADAAPPSPWHSGPRCAKPPPQACVDQTQARGYTQDYQYDLAGSLTQLKHTAAGGSFTRHLTPRPESNRLHTMTIGQNPFTYEYDDAGNMTRENTERHYTWDHADRLIAFTNRPDGSNHASVEARYLYGADGMRVKKWVRTNGAANGESRVYIDGIFEHHQWKEQGAPKQNNHLHVMDDQQRIAIIRRGDPDDADPENGIQYHLGDHLGSSNLVVDETGTWIDREEYTPYGETSFGSFAKKRYRFTGKERDEENGLYYHGARYYAPWLTKWTSCDPAGSRDFLNLYTFTRNNPANNIDTSGYQTEREQMSDPGPRSVEQILHQIASAEPETGDPQRATTEGFTVADPPQRSELARTEAEPSVEKYDVSVLEVFFPPLGYSRRNRAANIGVGRSVEKFHAERFDRASKAGAHLAHWTTVVAGSVGGTVLTLGLALATVLPGAITAAQALAASTAGAMAALAARGQHLITPAARLCRRIARWVTRHWRRLTAGAVVTAEVGNPVLEALESIYHEPQSHEQEPHEHLEQDARRSPLGRGAPLAPTPTRRPPPALPPRPRRVWRPPRARK